jgi:hypothetical protein
MTVELLTECTQVDSELDRQLEMPASELSFQARRHLDRCERCRNLYKWLSERPAAADASPELRRRIRGVLTASLAPVTPVPGIGILILQLIVMCGVLALALIARMGVAGAEQMSAEQFLGVTGILTAGAALFSMLLAWQMIPGSHRRLSTVLAVAVFGFGLFTGIALLFPWSVSSAAFSLGWPCTVRGLAMAALGAAVIWFVIRRGAPVSATAMGATLGATAGLLGVTVLQFACIHQQALHLLIWHGGVLALSSGAGALAGHVASRLARRP